MGIETARIKKLKSGMPNGGWRWESRLIKEKNPGLQAVVGRNCLGEQVYIST